MEDLSLRARIERLLSAHGESKIFFADCVPALSPAESGDVGNVVPADEKLGGCIGPYKLLQKIGEGGCGLVYMAEQENLCPFRIDLYAGI